MISVGAKVHVQIGERFIPAVVSYHQFASYWVYDLYMVRMAYYDQITCQWCVQTIGPVHPHRLTPRETSVPGLDAEARLCAQAHKSVGRQVRVSVSRRVRKFALRDDHDTSGWCSGRAFKRGARSHRS